MTAILKSVKNRSLSEEVFAALRDAIFAGKFRPGDQLREAHLAKELSVSQVTVRGALVRLERYGLVVRIPNKETIVTRHSKQEIRERMAIRTVLEEMACVEASRRMTADDFKTLERKLERLQEAARGNEYFESVQADLEFHRVIWRLAGNANLYEMLDHLTTPLMAFVSVMRSAKAEKLVDVLSPHDKLIRAMRSKKALLIKQAVRGHTTDGYHEFLNSENESLEAMLTRRA